jgi:hypothetical protein
MCSKLTPNTCLHIRSETNMLPGPILSYFSPQALYMPLVSDIIQNTINVMILDFFFYKHNIRNR